MLTRNSTGLLWQTPSSQKVFGSNDTTRETAGDGDRAGEKTVDISWCGFTSTPSIICTAVSQTNDRTISMVIREQTATSFKVISTVGGNHRHKTAHLGTRATQTTFNANRARAIVIDDAQGLLYSIDNGGNGNDHDVYSEDTAPSIALVPNINFNWVAIGN